MPDSTNLPNWEHPAIERMKNAWMVCSDVYAGTERLRTMCVGAVQSMQPSAAMPVANLLRITPALLYLPKHPGEEADAYLIRLFNTELFNALRATVKGLSGMVFAQDPKLGDDVPPELVVHWEDIDYAGTHGDVFARTVMENAMLRGHHGIFVDYPDLSDPGDLPVKTLADEQRAGLRPYWQQIRPDQMLNWRTGTLPNGEHVLTQVTLKLAKTIADGRFGEKHVDQYLTMWIEAPDVVMFERFEVRDNSAVTVAGPAVVRNQTRIPLAICYGNEPEGMLETTPPLLDLAYLNLAHFRVQSDHRYALHLSSIPILAMIGRDTTGKITASPNTALDIPLGGDAKYIEHSGSALGATATELSTLEGRMARMGLSMLQRESSAQETAEAKRLDKAEQSSTLAAMARNVEDALEQAMEFHAQYLGLDSGGSIALNRDFEGTSMSVEEMDSYSKQVSAGQLSLETMWDLLVAGGRLPADFDPKEEQQRIDAATLPPLDMTNIDPLTGLPMPSKPIIDLTQGTAAAA